MKICFSSFTQPVNQYIPGASDVAPMLVRLIIHQCEQGLITAPQLTFIVEGVTRSDAVFSTP